MINTYDHCISLGWFCGTASSMAMHGLRSFSGPFDWYYSDLTSVLQLIETDFNDFMSKDHLRLAEDNSKVFCDTKYGFYCNHDITADFEQEYPEIYKKYQRRATRFMEATKHPTCFLRAVRSEEEISFIRQNREYIYQVIQKGNPRNEIIFFLINNMTELPDNFLYFHLDIDCYIGKGYEMRTMFDSSSAFLKCIPQLLPGESINRNIFRDRSSLSRKNKIALIQHRVEESNDSIACAIKKYFANSNQGIYLWGAGAYGSLLLNYMIKHDIKVNAVIDNNENKTSSTINDIPIISFSGITQDNPNIFITVLSEQAVISITEQINCKCPNSSLLTLDALYGYPNFPDLIWY